MLPAAQRLHQSDDIRRATRMGRRIVGRDVVLHILRNDDLPTGPRVCVIVSKAVGNAVVRNSVRRRLREAVRPLVVSLPGGTDVVVRARDSACNSSFASLSVQVSELVSRWLNENDRRSSQ